MGNRNRREMGLRPLGLAKPWLVRGWRGLESGKSRETEGPGGYGGPPTLARNELSIAGRSNNKNDCTLVWDAPVLRIPFRRL